MHSLWSLCRCGDIDHRAISPNPVADAKSAKPPSSWAQDRIPAVASVNHAAVGVTEASQPDPVKVQSPVHSPLPGVPAAATATANGNRASLDARPEEPELHMKSSEEGRADGSSGDSGQAGPGPGHDDTVWRFEHLGNLRDARYPHRLPKGKCIYIQSGDPSDFDGYLIARAGEVLSKLTPDLVFSVVIPEERSETRDINVRDEKAEVSMDQCGRMLRYLCPHATVVRGPVNQKNIFALMNSPEKYLPALATIPDSPENKAIWTSLGQLVSMVNDPSVTSVVLDLMGSSGFMEPLLAGCPNLAQKVINSNYPIPFMGGVLAEKQPQTMKVPGRDPRAGMNCIYHKPQELLQLVKLHRVPVLFVSNNCTRDVLKFEDDVELVRELGLTGLLKQIAECWFAPHLQGKYVVFDWVAMVALLLFQRRDDCLTVEDRELWVGEDDCSVMVLKNPGDPMDEIIQENLKGTVYYGTYKSVVNMDRKVLLDLARELKYF